MGRAQLKTVADYMKLSYTVVMRLDEEGDVIAEIQELPGCVAHGRDPSEAWKNLRDVQQAWIEDCLESGETVPEPEPEEDLPSGKWVQRVPRTLHKRLGEFAKSENVSLNQLVTSMLSASVMARSVQAYMYEHAAEGYLLSMASPTQLHPWDFGSFGYCFHAPGGPRLQEGWMGSLAKVQRLLPEPRERKDAYNPKDITKNYTHKDLTDTVRR